MKLLPSASWRYIISKTPENNAGVPFFHFVAQIWWQIPSAFQLQICWIQQSLNIYGQQENLCASAVLLYTNPKKRSPGACPDGNEVQNYHGAFSHEGSKHGEAMLTSSSSFCLFVTVTDCFLHRLRPIMMTSLGKPSILATSKHPSLL